MVLSVRRAGAGVGARQARPWPAENKLVVMMEDVVAFLAGDMEYPMFLSMLDLVEYPNWKGKE